MEFRHSGQDCFVAAAPLSHSQWTVLVFVPAQVMAANTLSMTRLTLAYFVLVGVIIAFVLTCLSLSLMLYRNNKRRMAQRSRDGRILSRAAERVNSANAAKNQFISHMSHDVRTPINGIVGMTNIALKSLDQPARVENCLRKINSAANRLLTLMSDVQEMSRLESGKVEITATPLELRTLLDGCCSTINGQLVDRKVTLLREFEPFDHPYLLGDALHTRQVLLNLLGSAAQYTPDGGTIRFRAQELWAENGTARFRFEWIDDGIGIRPEFLAHIFDPFAQEDGGDRAAYQGSGLGMAVSKQLVELMGGTIAVESQLNQGSRFTVELPFAINPEKTPPCANVSLEGLRVLVVEDNELNLEIAQELLSEEGVIVSTAENGQLGLDAFLSAPSGTFDVILMDVTMPVLDGYEATRAIRASAHPQAATIPIIAITANAYAEDVAAAREAGMNDHVAKPIDMDRLLYILSQYNATRPVP
jgi:signal transduction histidine kinase/CheY-like chemotaxis protein